MTIVFYTSLLIKKMKYKINLRKLVCFVFCLVFAFAAYVFYQNWSFIGFPDSSRTELDEINIKLYPVYIAISGLFSVFFLYFGIAKQKNDTFTKTLQIGITLAFVFFVLIIIANYVLSMNFNHGQGG